MKRPTLQKNDSSILYFYFVKFCSTIRGITLPKRFENGWYILCEMGLCNLGNPISIESAKLFATLEMVL